MRYKILIFEDEKPIADILCYGLRKEGFWVESAETESTNFMMVMDSRPDLVLLDWMLPDIEGIDLCHMITEQYNIPIIMLIAKRTVRVENLDRGKIKFTIILDAFYRGGRNKASEMSCGNFPVAALRLYSIAIQLSREPQTRDVLILYWKQGILSTGQSAGKLVRISY